MALFEGSVAFVMIGAVMKSMDPSLEEASQVIGGGRLRTMLRVTLPLVAPGVLGAPIFVFAEMLGSFSAALVLGAAQPVLCGHHGDLPAGLSNIPPRLPLAAAMGVSLFVVMFVMLLHLPPHVIVGAASSPSPARRSARGRWTWAALRWVLFGVCAFYVLLSVVLPIADPGLCLAAEDRRRVSQPLPTGRWTTIAPRLT